MSKILKWLTRYQRARRMAQWHLQQRKAVLFQLATGTPLRIEGTYPRRETVRRLIERGERHGRALDRIARIMRGWR